MRGLRLAIVALALVVSGCFTPPTTPVPKAGQFHLELLGATPSADAMRWNVALSNGNADVMPGVKVMISVQYYRTKDAGHAQLVLDVPANQTAVVVLNTTYLGYGDYDYTLQAFDAHGNVLDGEQDLFELCLC